MSTRLQQKEEKANQLHWLNCSDHKLETQISDTKLQMRDLFSSFTRPSRTSRNGMQRLCDVKPLTELQRGLGRLASLGGLRDD